MKRASKKIALFHSWYIPLSLFIGTFIIYLTHLSPSVFGGDSGDFLSAIIVRGVAHPSGYPLYTILGIIFNALPIGKTVAWRVSIVSAFCSAGTVAAVYLMIDELIHKKWIAIISSLTLAFLFPFWLYAEIPEVFALHHFLLLLILYMALRLYHTKKIHYAYFLALTFGLSLTNHELTILMLFPIILLLRRTFPSLNISPKQRVYILLFFLLGLSLYAYIPIAASQHPLINWDDASTWQGFFQLITRSDYGWSPHGGKTIAIAVLSLRLYISYLMQTIPLFVFGLAALGVFFMVKQKKYTVFFTVLLSFLLFGPVFEFYNSNVTLDNLHFGIYEKFYASSLLFFIIFVAYGIHYICELTKTTLHTKFPIVIIFCCLPIYFFTINTAKTDLHALWIGDSLGKNALQQIPPHSIIATNNDTLLFNARYIQAAYNVRKDITLSTPLEANQVSLASPSKRPLLVTADDFADLSDAGRKKLMPFGLFFLVTNDPPYTKDQYITLQQSILNSFSLNDINLPIRHLLLVADIPLWYARAWAYTGYYIVSAYNDYEAALPFFQKAITIHPDTDIAHEGLADYFVQKGLCQKAKEQYTEAIRLEIAITRPYLKLYTVVSNCLHDEKETKRLEELFLRYPNLFHVKNQ